MSAGGTAGSPLSSARSRTWAGERHHFSEHVISQALGLLRGTRRVQEENIRICIYTYICISKTFLALVHV